jgi:hypothetical protein
LTKSPFSHRVRKALKITASKGVEPAGFRFRSGTSP